MFRFERGLSARKPLSGGGIGGGRSPPPRLSAGGAGRGEPRRDLARRAEREGDGHGPEADPARADEEPEVAAERVVDPAAGKRPERHADRRDESDRAEGGADDA